MVVVVVVLVVVAAGAAVLPSVGAVGVDSSHLLAILRLFLLDVSSSGIYTYTNAFNSFFFFFKSRNHTHTHTHTYTHFTK